MITETIEAKSKSELELKKQDYLKEYPTNPYFTSFKYKGYDPKKNVFQLEAKRSASCD